MERVTMNVTEQVVPRRQTTRRPHGADPDAGGDINSARSRDDSSQVKSVQHPASACSMSFDKAA